MSDLIEKMERRSWNPVTRTVDWEAVARVMLEDQQNYEPDDITDDEWEAWCMMLSRYAKEKDIE